MGLYKDLAEKYKKFLLYSDRFVFVKKYLVDVVVRINVVPGRQITKLVMNASPRIAAIRC